MSKYWFKRRRYGWGWTPSTWQGWVMIAVYAIVLIGGGYIVDVRYANNVQGVLVFMIFVMATTFLLLRICFKVAPKPKWRWGLSDTDNPEEDY